MWSFPNEFLILSVIEMRTCMQITMLNEHHTHIQIQIYRKRKTQNESEKSYATFLIKAMECITFAKK